VTDIQSDCLGLHLEIIVPLGREKILHATKMTNADTSILVQVPGNDCTVFATIMAKRRQVIKAQRIKNMR
jgi:hypothetical protein